MSDLNDNTDISLNFMENDTMEYIQNNFLNILQNALQEVQDLSNSLNVDISQVSLNTENNAFFNTYIVNSFINNVITSNQQIQDVINNSLYDKLPYKNVLIPELFKDFEEIIYNGSNTLNDKCSFSLENLEIGKKYTKLPCEHAFSTEELETWLLEESNLCPICRYEFPYWEKRNI